MSMEIYYFSGTGNTLAVARDIAERTGADLIPIASLKERKQIETEADVIGIVFPVYYGELPIIVKEFVEKLVKLKCKYIFSVCTYGGNAMASLRILKSILWLKGGELSAAYGVHMPQNSFFKPRENRQKIYSSWEKKLEQIEKNTMAKTKGLFNSNYFLESVFVLIQHILIRPICKRAFVKQTNMTADTRIEELVRMMDIGFEANENCNGCGICLKVCPVSNIIVNNNKPVWMHRCETCLACYNWCPNRAIQGGITSKGYYYHHPAIDISEIINQKNYASKFKI